MSFVTAALIIGGTAAAGTIGAAAIGASSNGGQPNINNPYTPGPNAATGKEATDNWWKQLQQDQSDPNWGAISPDWNDIWQQTQQQVHNYFNGSAMTPGVNDQIKASFAQRGMSGDPAASFLTAQSGAEEAQQLNNASMQQNIARQKFANEGKTQWLHSIADLQNQASNGAAGGNWGGQVISPTGTQQIANAAGAGFSAAGSAGINYLGQQSQLNWLNSMMGPSTYGTDVMSAGDMAYLGI